MASTLNRHFSFYNLLLCFLAITSITILSTNAASLNPGSYVPITASPGVYNIYFSSSPGCKSTTLGYTQNIADLSRLSSSPSSFTTLKSPVNFDYSSYDGIPFTSTTYIVLFNNGTSICTYSSFTKTLEINTLYLSRTTFTIPYGVTKTFKSTYSSSYSKLLVESSSAIRFYANVDTLYSTPTAPGTPSTVYSIGFSGSTTVKWSPSSNDAYIYLKCDTPSGCNSISLMVAYGSDSNADSSIIGAIIGPIVFVVIFAFIVIISVVSTIFARRRRMLLLAAATTAVATSSTTTHNYVPVPTPVSTTTTTTEKTTVYVPPPVATTAQQPYMQPGIPQPYNPNYGNQAYYSQPPPTTGQPYQPQPYTQPYAQPYTSQPYTPQPYPNQPPPPYYNPGVGVAQQEPMPAFNPNVDRV